MIQSISSSLPTQQSQQIEGPCRHQPLSPLHLESSLSSMQRRNDCLEDNNCEPLYYGIVDFFQPVTDFFTHIYHFFTGLFITDPYRRLPVRSQEEHRRDLDQALVSFHSELETLANNYSSPQVYFVVIRHEVPAQGCEFICDNFLCDSQSSALAEVTEWRQSGERFIEETTWENGDGLSFEFYCVTREGGTIENPIFRMKRDRVSMRAGDAAPGSDSGDMHGLRRENIENRLTPESLPQEHVGQFFWNINFLS